MNNSIAVPNDGSWPLAPFDPDAAAGSGRANARIRRRASSISRRIVRIVYHWRWLVLGAIALGLAGAILTTLLTTPIYRAWVTLEANPPTVSVSDEQSREREATNVNPYDFVATQVGLLSSSSVAQRTAQELNLANNADWCPADVDASQRLRAGTGDGRGWPRRRGAGRRAADQVQL